MENKLFPFQGQAVEIMAKRRHTLLADSMGLGKTIQAIALIDKIKAKKTLIICKASIKENWKRKIIDWLPGQRIQIVNKKTDDIDWNFPIVIVNYDLISHSYIFQQLIRIDWDLLICDEAHYLKSAQAQRTKAVLAKNGLVHHAKRTLMITGTPILNRPIELYPMLKVLSPETIIPYSDYYRYGKRFCAGFQDGFSFNVNGASHTLDLNERLRRGYMIRRTYEEVEMELPKRRYEITLVDQPDGMAAQMTILEDAERKDFKFQKFDGGELATVRREVAEKKIEVCLNQIREWVNGNDKTLIFAYHHSVINKLSAELFDMWPVVITGETPSRQRQPLIDEFVKDPGHKVMLGQIQAAGEGIDGLQAVCHNVIFVEADWSPGVLNQAIARVWRLGQEHPVLIRFLVWSNSFDEHQMRTVLDKVKIIMEVLK